MVFGSFTKFNGVSASRVIRLLENGLSDNRFNSGETGANNLIKTAVLQSDNKIILGGSFTKYNGRTCNRLVRILPDGEIDNTFNTGSGFKGQVYALAMQEGKIIVAGNFTTYNDVPAVRIVRLLEDGSRDQGFNAGLGADAIIEAVLIQSDGKILVAGRFNTFDDQLFSRLVRLNYDGSIDSGFHVGSGFDKFVFAMALQSDNKIIIGGSFVTYNGDADLFLSKNALNIKGTLYFWTHNTPVTDNKYTTNDYAVYNLLGGVGTKAALGPGVNETIPDGTIASGQGFFIKSKNSGIVEFNNSMRIVAGNSTFFKPAKANNQKNKNAIEKHRIWLNFENKEGAFKQILLGYIQGATNFYDENFDAETFNGNAYVDFYSVNDAKKLVIQGRALPFTMTDTIPLAYHTTIADDFTISIDHADGDLSNRDIYLEDKITGVIHDLRASNYTFTTAIGTFTDRLVLRYTDKSLGTEDFKNHENGISVSVKNKVINISSSSENIKEVSIYDITGKQLYNKKKINNTELQIQNLSLSNQVLLVKVTLQNDFTTTKKTLF